MEKVLNFFVLVCLLIDNPFATFFTANDLSGSEENSDDDFESKSIMLHSVSVYRKFLVKKFCVHHEF